MRKFELKSVKYLSANSRDSHCFSATLYVDGKRFCRASDDGWGGQINFDTLDHKSVKQNEIYHRVADIDAELIKEFGEKTYDRKDGSTFSIPEKTLEYIVCDLVNDFLTARELKSKLAKKVVYIQNGQCLETQNARNKELLGRWIEEVINEDGTEEVLNILPFDKALEAYRAAV